MILLRTFGNDPPLARFASPMLDLVNHEKTQALAINNARDSAFMLATMVALRHLTEGRTDDALEAIDGFGPQLASLVRHEAKSFEREAKVAAKYGPHPRHIERAQAYESLAASLRATVEMWESAGGHVLGEPGGEAT